MSHSSLWGGSDAIFGDPVLAIWEGDVQYFGVQFGRGVGYHQVKVMDCLCMDWRLWPQMLPSKVPSVVNQHPTSLVYDGITTTLQTHRFFSDKG